MKEFFSTTEKVTKPPLSPEELQLGAFIILCFCFSIIFGVAIYFGVCWLLNIPADGKLTEQQEKNSNIIAFCALIGFVTSFTVGVLLLVSEYNKQEEIRKKQEQSK